MLSFGDYSEGEIIKSLKTWLYFIYADLGHTNILELRYLLIYSFEFAPIYQLFRIRYIWLVLLRFWLGFKKDYCKVG